MKAGELRKKLAKIDDDVEVNVEVRGMTAPLTSARKFDFRNPTTGEPYQEVVLMSTKL